LAAVEASGDYQACAVCGRTILRGERTSPYLDSERNEVAVCALCKPRAEASGWVPAALADAVAEPPGQRRRLALPNGLRERLARAAVAARPPRPDEDDSQPSEPEAEAEPPEPSGPLDPVEAFNASEGPRRVAALTKSLGEPKVTIRGEIITVAWELSWYQWRVRDSQVTQTANGSEISELPGADRAWNAEAAADGTLNREP
jgi:hypothetical protein